MLELKELGESNYQLLAINRNLNQMTKILHQERLVYDLNEMMLKLRTTIRTHTKKVGQALRASVGRWVAKRIAEGRRCGTARAASRQWTGARAGACGRDDGA